MKKILFIIITTFLFINCVQAQTTEEELNELKNTIKQLEEKYNNNEINRLNKTYPIGSIYETTAYSTKEEVENNIGGTWEIYSNGRSLIGVNQNDGNFNTVNKTGGSATTSLVAGNLPSHNHSIPTLYGTAANAGAHSHSFYDGILLYTEAKNGNVKFASGVTYGSFGQQNTTAATNAAGTHSHTVSINANNTKGNGSGTAFTNLPPYITVYMYKRVA